MRINAKISFFTQNTVKMVLFFRAKVLFFNENQGKNGLKSLIFDDQNKVATLSYISGQLLSNINMSYKLIWWSFR